MWHFEKHSYVQMHIDVNLNFLYWKNFKTSREILHSTFLGEIIDSAWDKENYKLLCRSKAQEKDKEENTKNIQVSTTRKTLEYCW